MCSKGYSSCLVCRLFLCHSVSLLGGSVVVSVVVITHSNLVISGFDKIQKHFQNVMLVGMASKISKNYTYKCVDRSRHNGIKGAKAKCAH